MNRSDAEYQRKRRQNETPEKRAKRLAADSARRAAKATGERRGPKLIVEGDPTKAKSITLPESYWETAATIGDGVYSAGVRIAIEEAQQRRESTPGRKRK